ncbi:condensation domain-containing protein [Streptomyces sp. NRRL S-1022]|uniref:condensation domain-containing protein n=1 Tax=Streptomyces sp. NRRL S-1022 TaxID=1463880 RepID=UPI0004BF0C67|nr:condensation domain-containing protein [Streptomyces sp. NRRL S-1022]
MTADTPRRTALARRLADLSPAQRAQLERRLAERERTGARRPATRIPPRAPGAGPLPLSWSQEHMWHRHRADPSGAAYLVPLRVRLDGDLRIEVLRAAFRDVVSRHEILRTTFGETDGVPYQLVHDDLGADVEFGDLRGAGDTEAAVAARLAEEAARPYDLAEGPLLRAVLLRTADDVHVLSLVLHHILTDEQSTGLLLAEFVEAYERRLRGLPAAAPPRLQYADFAVWQRSGQGAGTVAADLRRSVRRLAGMPDGIRLPADRPRPPRPTGRGGAVGATVGPQLWRLLRELARGEQATEVMVLLAVFQVLLRDVSGQDDITVSMPTAGRGHPDLEGVLGCFFNTVAVRCDLSGTPAFRSLLRHVRTRCLEAYDDREVPFTEVVEAVTKGRAENGHPLLQTMVVFEREGAGRPVEFAGLRLTPLPAPTAHRAARAKRDLTVQAVDQGDTARLTLVYDADLFDPATAEGILDRYTALLSSLVRDPDGRLTPPDGR